MGWWSSSSESQEQSQQTAAAPAAKSQIESSPDSSAADTAQSQRRSKSLSYDYGETTVDRLIKDETLARPLPTKGEIKQNPYKRNRGVFHEREEVNEPERDSSIFSRMEEQRHTAPGPFQPQASTKSDDPLDAWNNALFFFYRRPALAVSIWGLSACFLSMVAGVALRRSSNDVVFVWGNATLAFKIATLGSLYYYNTNPPKARLPASYIQAIREQQQQQQASAAQMEPDVKTAQDIDMT